jgi:gliding motility-associated-like protein
VTVDPLPTVSFTGLSAPYCSNGTGDTLTGNQAPSGTFSGSGVADLGSGEGYFDPNAVSPGTHDIYYSYTDANGCSETDTQSVNVLDPPVIDTSSKSITNATCGNSDGRIENIAINGGSSPYTYEWRDGSNTVVGSSLDLTGVPSGNYTLNVTDNNGCVDTLGPIPINDIGGPTVDAGSDSTICQGDSLTIGGSPTATGGTSPYSYSWTNGSSLDNDTLANPKAGPSSTTTYTVTVTDDNGCNGSDQMTLNIAAPATVDAGADSSICADDTVDLDGSYGGTASSVTWSSSGDGSFSSTSDPKGSYFPGSNDTSSGSATLTLRTNDPTGPCPAVSDSMKLSFMSVPKPALKDTAICPGDSIWLTASGGGSYNWSTGHSGDSVAVAPASDSSFWVDVTAPNGCDAMDSNLVSVLDPASVSTKDDSLILEGGGSADVDVLANDSGSSFLVTHLELPEDGNINGPNNGVFTYFSDGNDEKDSFSYRACEPVCLEDCDTAYVRVELEYEEREDLFIPNGVSANGDGKNDVLHISGLDQYPDNSLKIFNRWGELVYSASPYENDWKGQSQGGKVLEGTYFYVLKLEPGKKETGYIEFVR